LILKIKIIKAKIVNNAKKYKLDLINIIYLISILLTINKQIRNILGLNKEIFIKLKIFKKFYQIFGLKKCLIFHNLYTFILAI
jgi:hypothetical protein